MKKKEKKKGKKDKTKTNRNPWNEPDIWTQSMPQAIKRGMSWCCEEVLVRVVASLGPKSLFLKKNLECIPQTLLCLQSCALLPNLKCLSLPLIGMSEKVFSPEVVWHFAAIQLLCYNVLYLPLFDGPQALSCLASGVTNYKQAECV